MTNLDTALKTSNSADTSSKKVEERLKIALGCNLSDISAGIFSGYKLLNIPSLPPGVMTIGSAAFNECEGLTTLTMGQFVKTIAQNAFLNCKGLTSVTINSTVTPSIASGAFYGCKNLKTINAYWAEGAVANAPWGATNATINYNYRGG